MISYLEKCAFSKHFLEAFRANQVTDHDRSTLLWIPLKVFKVFCKTPVPVQFRAKGVLFPHVFLLLLFLISAHRDQLL